MVCVVACVVACTISYVVTCIAVNKGGMFPIRTTMASHWDVMQSAKETRHCADDDDCVFAGGMLCMCKMKQDDNQQNYVSYPNEARGLDKQQSNQKKEKRNAKENNHFLI
ncbi:uncharacterized protein SPSK_06738 [Sporothrix schenckii 1099-18]|uniref:Uncharacterized protein n=1 Tax=Sporothrix schenckii 1099-18 TaxID=1397361 RepID=A0A0F2MLU4_SPOSC|nr:uncharacterized protein SPSK_06738 [Sporothrix schenckii 1099-18]KJR89156.1 hypothetical protein SPSK_06738 [Sporothrix schenckii 1099-18]